MTRPKYRDLSTDRLEELETDGGAKIRVIAGEAAVGPLTGPVEGLSVKPKFIDVVLPPKASFREAIEPGHTAFAYVEHGELFFGRPEKRRVEGPSLVIFGDGEFVEVTTGEKGGNFLLAAARPLNEPIARYGPFVMNTRSEIEQTLRDLRTGRFIREEPKDQ